MPNHEAAGARLHRCLVTIQQRRGITRREPGMCMRENTTVLCQQMRSSFLLMLLLLGLLVDGHLIHMYNTHTPIVKEVVVDGVNESSGDVQVQALSSASAEFLALPPCLSLKESPPVSQTQCLKIFFVHVPKTGGESVNLSLMGAAQRGALKFRSHHEKFARWVKRQKENPMVDRRVAVEMHVSTHSFYSQVDRLMDLRDNAYRQHNCTMILTTVLRNSKASMLSSYAYCNRRGASLTMSPPKLWHNALHCSLHDPQVSFLTHRQRCSWKRKFGVRPSPEGYDAHTNRLIVALRRSMNLVGSTENMKGYIEALSKAIGIPLDVHKSNYLKDEHGTRAFIQAILETKRLSQTTCEYNATNMAFLKHVAMNPNALEDIPMSVRSHPWYRDREHAPL